MYPYAIRVNLVFLSISCFIPSLHPEVFRWFQKHDQFQMINIFFYIALLQKRYKCYKHCTMLSKGRKNVLSDATNRNAFGLCNNVGFRCHI